MELIDQEISFEREKEIEIYYKGALLNKKYRADFLCFNKIVVELKAISKLTTEHEAILLNYLKGTEMKVGILINFGAKSLEYKRMVY